MSYIVFVLFLCIFTFFILALHTVYFWGVLCRLLLAISARWLKMFLKFVSSMWQNLNDLSKSRSEIEIIYTRTPQNTLCFLHLCWIVHDVRIVVLFLLLVSLSHHNLCLNIRKRKKERLNISFLEVVVQQFEYGNTLIYKPWCYMELF